MSKEIFKKAIAKWGESAQFEMLQEEATELALAARKFNRKLSAEAKENLIEEIADVEIMIEQVKLMHPEIKPQVLKVKDFKIARLEQRINENKFNG